MRAISWDVRRCRCPTATGRGTLYNPGQEIVVFRTGNGWRKFFAVWELGAAFGRFHAVKP
jgi:hypothetical protein